MIKRHEFIERTLFLIRKELSQQLPNEAILDDMIDKTKKIINKIL